MHATTLESMAPPCSVKAYGGRAAKSAQLEVTICDFKFSNSLGLSWNMKSAGTAAIAGDFRDITRTFAALIRSQLTTCLASGGGEGGIRTHDTLARIPVFETGTFNRSVTSPAARILPAANAAAL